MAIGQPMVLCGNCSVYGIVWQLLSIWNFITISQYSELYDNYSVYGIV